MKAAGLSHCGAALLVFTAWVAHAQSEVDVSAAPGEGFTVQRRDGQYLFNLRARTQLRESVSAQDRVLGNELSLRTIRLAAQGSLYTRDFRYFLQVGFGAAEFEPGNASPILDAYLEYGGLRDLQLRAGQFFVPFDRARTVREFALQLVDRQQVVTELNLDRDVGLMAFSNDLFGLGGKLGYAAGVFAGGGRNRVGFERPAFLCAGRIAVRPLGAFDDDVEGDLQRLRTPRLALGLAAGFNQDSPRARSTSGTTFTLGGFDYAHAAADLVFKWRGFSLLGEVLYRRAAVPFHDGSVLAQPVREWSRSGAGYLVQAGYMLSSKVELAARWDQLAALGPTDPALQAFARGQGRELGGGLNLYLNGHALKVQTDYALHFGEGVPPSHLWRLQLDATL